MPARGRSGKMGVLNLFKKRAASGRTGSYVPGLSFFCIVLAAAFVVLNPIQAAAIAADLPGAAGGMKAPASAVEPGAESGTITLKGLVEHAVDNNPRIRAARLKWESVKEKYPQATSYDDPMLMYIQPVREIETRLGPQERVIALNQKIPFPGKLGLKGDIVTKEIEIARTEYEKAVRDLTTGVKKVYYELYYIDKAIELAQENDAVLEFFEEVSRANYGLSVSELDELVRAQKLSAKASLDLIRLDDIRTSFVSRLNTLLFRPQDYPVGKVGEADLKPFSHSLDELMNWGVANYEELKIAGLKIEKSELETDLARYSYLPNFQIGVNYSQIGDPPMPVTDAGDDAYAVTFGINIPIWFSKNRAAVSQASINREKSLVEKSAVTNELENTIKSVYFNLTNSERIVRLYGDTLVPEAKESLEFAEARYKSGEEMLGRLLETQSLWINFRLVYYRSLADYLKSIAELERLTAKELY
jgi:outer membrane protein TolC